MKVFICLLAVAALAQAEIDWDRYKPRNIHHYVKGHPSFGNGRIVGGDEAEPHQFPWQVALLIDTNAGSFFCGGSLISRQYVLTAAHCVDGAESVTAILGAHRFRQNEPGQVRVTTKIAFTHENWDPMLIQNDIAMVKFTKPVELSDTIQLVNLPSRSDVSETFVGDLATVSGWGKDSDYAPSVSEVLRFVRADIITNTQCNKDYQGFVKSSNICANGAGGKSSCNGDSGGPLTVNDNGTTKQVGIVSFGRVEGCERGFAHVYTRVTSFLDWIQQNSDVVIN